MHSVAPAPLIDPAEQARHSLLPALSENVPASHGSQPPPPAVMRDPAAHVRHASPPRLYIPSGHAAQSASPALLWKPGAHAAQSVPGSVPLPMRCVADPRGAKPALHREQAVLPGRLVSPSGQAEHDALPSWLLMVPAAHGVHSLLPARLKVPAGQGSILTDPALAVKKPASASRHSSWFGPLRYEPAWQVLQDVLPGMLY